MPLPFAPPPKDSSIYNDLKTSKLNNLTPDILKTLRNRLYSTGSDGLEDDYRRLLLLGLASGSFSIPSGPIPNTQQVVKVIDTTGSGNPTGDLFVPEEGEVWEISTLEWQAKAGSNLTIYIENAAGDKSIIDYATSGVQFTYSGTVHVGYPCKLTYKIGSSSGSNTITCSVIETT